MSVKSSSTAESSLSSNPSAVPGPILRTPWEEPGDDLVVDRDGIEFFDAPGKRVRIRIRVQNRSDRRSPSRLMAVYSAPLGAFLPWRHLTTLTVPSLPPGAQTVVKTLAERARPPALGRIDRIPPAALITAIGEVDDAGRRSGRGRLAPGILDCFNRLHSHWMGNINVFVNKRGVERHLARGLRVQPGRPNGAVFFVGDGNMSDAYAFRILGDAAAWDSRLFAPSL